MACSPLIATLPAERCKPFKGITRLADFDKLLVERPGDMPAARVLKMLMSGQQGILLHGGIRLTAINTAGGLLHHAKTVLIEGKSYHMKDQIES